MALPSAQLQRAGAVEFPRPREFLKLVSEFFPASVSLLHMFWLSQRFLIRAVLLSCAISSLRLSVSALDSRIFSVFAKQQATRVSRWVLASKLPPLRRAILSPASIYEDVEIPLPLAMPRYRALIFL